MLNKKKSFLILIFLILVFSFSPQIAFASALQTYINEMSAKQVSDVALKDLFGQTGYRVGSQAEIDAIRAKAKISAPELANKYSLLFGITQDTFLDPDATYTQEEIDKFNETGFESIARVTLSIGADLRSWINNTIGDLKSSPSDDSSTDNYSWDAGEYVVIQGEGGIPRRFTFLSGMVLTSTNKNIPFGNGYRTHTYWNLWNASGSHLWVDEQFGLAPFTFSVTPVKTNSQEEKFKNYVPYPSTSSEIGTQRVPSKISVPVKVGEDGYVVPQISPLEFPSIKTEPNTDGLVETTNSTITYTDPVVDSVTDEVVDGITPTPPSGDLEVPSGIPTLNFKPLMVATRKFPFSIPWDLAQCYKVFEGDEKPFSYEFKEVKLNGIVTGGQSITVVPNFKIDFSEYPSVDVAIKIFKYLQLLLFITMLIVKTRGLIRG